MSDSGRSAKSEVGYVNSNGMMNVGLASEQPKKGPGVTWLHVQHCTRCHRNCATFEHTLADRQCPHCGDRRGGPGRPLSEADLKRRCTAAVCYEP